MSGRSPIREPPCRALCQNRAMELTWYGRTCIRLRGRTRSSWPIPTSRSSGRPAAGITGDIVTFSHPDDTTAAAGQGQGVARRAARCCRRAWTPRSSSTGPASTRSRTSSLTGVRTYRDDAKGAERRQAGRLRRRARRAPHDPPRRHRPSPVRGEARRHRLGRHRVRAARRLAQRRPAPRRSSPSSIRGSWSRCRSARTRPTAPRRSRKFFHEMGARAVDAAEAVGDALEPAGRDRRPSCSSRAASRSDRAAGPAVRPGPGRPARA